MVMVLTNKQWQRLLARDGGRCVHCGETVALSPNHRANRGMGGSKLRDRPANLVVLCSMMNARIEYDPIFAEMAKKYGWKLSSWQKPESEPIYDLLLGAWFLLDDDYNRVAV